MCMSCAVAPTRSARSARDEKTYRAPQRTYLPYLPRRPTDLASSVLVEEFFELARQELARVVCVQRAGDFITSCIGSAESRQG